MTKECCLALEQKLPGEPEVPFYTSTRLIALVTFQALT